MKMSCALPNLIKRRFTALGFCVFLVNFDVCPAIQCKQWLYCVFALRSISAPESFATTCDAYLHLPLAMFAIMTDLRMHGPKQLLLEIDEKILKSLKKKPTVLGKENI